MKKHESELASLADPTQYTEALDVQNLPIDYLLNLFSEMVKIRYVEEAIADLSISGEARCPVHLGIGQEATAVGVAQMLKSTDRAFGAHRSHSHFLSMGGSVDEILAEVLGKVTGCSRGMGGSMHLFGKDFGFYGSVPIVAGTIPLAVGAALAAKMEKQGNVAIAYFGDGACEEGVLHESLNLASQFELPILFVCENNLYSSHLDISQRQPSDSVGRFGRAHKVDTRVIDGNDVIGVARTTEELVGAMRKGGGPGFIEAVTYRWRGHVGPDENVDVGVRRKASDIAAWKLRDPIGRLKQGILNINNEIEPMLEEIQDKSRSDIAQSVEFARSSAYPEDAQNFSSVYST